MAIGIGKMTAAEFDQFVLRPENVARSFEYIGGEVVEVVSNQRSSMLAARINGFLFMYLLQNKIGFLTSSDGGYMIAGERYIPDVAFVSHARQPEPSVDAYSRIPPDLVVEVVSPSNTAQEMRVKVVNYLSVGTVVWVVEPDQQLVEVYMPGQPVDKIDVAGTLDGGSILPGFTLAVAAIFTT